MGDSASEEASSAQTSVTEKRGSRASRSMKPSSDFRDSVTKISVAENQALPHSIATDSPRSDAPSSFLAESLPLDSPRRSSNAPRKSSAVRKSKKYVPPKHVVKNLSTVTRTRQPSIAPNSHQHRHINKLLQDNTQQLMSELTPEVQKAFETLFDRIDMTDSGGITPKEVQNLIKKHTDKTLTLKQVRQVLQDLDVKGTGDIEFDEFIFMLSQPGNYVRLLDRHEIKDLETKTGKTFNQPGKNAKSDPTHVFFEALRNATRQDSMTALRVFYRNRLKKLNDHVIHDWSAGQRCIGLSDQEMLKRYETIQGELLRQRVNFCKDNSYKQSPYARPLEWGVVNLRDSIIDRRRQRQLEELETKEKKDTRQNRPKMSEFVVTPKAVPLPRYCIHQRSPLKRTFNYDQLAGIRDKVDNIALKYYTELKDVARDNSTIVKKELAVDEIKNNRSRQNFMHTFTAYCAPFVVSPWIPMPSPTLQASFAPLGKSKHSVQK